MTLTAEGETPSDRLGTCSTTTAGGTCGLPLPCAWHPAGRDQWVENRSTEGWCPTMTHSADTVYWTECPQPDCARTPAVTTTLSADYGPAHPLIAKHATRHAETGSTFHVWFPPEAPFDVMERAMDAMAEIAVEIEREGWDTSVWTTRP